MKTKTPLISLKTWTFVSLAVLVAMIITIVTLWTIESPLLRIVIDISLGTFVFLTVSWWIWFLTAFRSFLSCWFRTEIQLFEVMKELRYLRKLLSEEQQKLDK